MRRGIVAPCYGSISQRRKGDRAAPTISQFPIQRQTLCTQRLCLAEADHDDRAEAALGEFAHRLFALAVVLNLEFLIGGAGILLELLRAPIGAFIEALVVLSADAIHLLDNAAVLSHYARIERILLLEEFEVLHRDADVEIVRAGFEEVLAVSRRLVGDDGVDGRVEEQWLHAPYERIDRLTAVQRKGGA